MPSSAGTSAEKSAILFFPEWTQVNEKLKDAFLRLKVKVLCGLSSPSSGLLRGNGNTYLLRLHLLITWRRSWGHLVQFWKDSSFLALLNGATERLLSR